MLFLPQGASYINSPMAATLTTIGDRVHFAQTDLVNWTLVTGDDGVMLIDTGFPGQRTDVFQSLRDVGFAAEQVTAILLTHAQHRPFRYCHLVRENLGDTPVLATARKSATPSATTLSKPHRPGRSPPYLAATLASLVGDDRQQRWPTARRDSQRPGRLTDAVAATLPGHPVAVPTPGHTGGHCSYLIDDVLVSGDALVTGHPLRRSNRSCYRSCSTMIRPDVWASRARTGPIRGHAARAWPGGVARSRGAAAAARAAAR